MKNFKFYELIIFLHKPFRAESSTCQVKDPLSGHLFDLEDLRNATNDFTISIPPKGSESRREEIKLNVCGGNLASSDKTVAISQVSKRVIFNQSPSKQNDGVSIP